MGRGSVAVRTSGSQCSQWREPGFELSCLNTHAHTHTHTHTHTTHTHTTHYLSIYPSIYLSIYLHSYLSLSRMWLCSKLSNQPNYVVMRQPSCLILTNYPSKHIILPNPTKYDKTNLIAYIYRCAIIYTTTD